MKRCKDKRLFLLYKNDGAAKNNDKRSKNYQAIHYWIHSRYGLANHCEFCKTTSAKRYQWALKKGHTYERKINNYIQLCDSCHRKYDFTKTTIKRMSESRNNYLNSEKGAETKKSVSKKVKEIWSNPEYKKRLHESRKNWWKTATKEQKEYRTRGIRGITYNVHTKTFKKRIP